MFEDLPVDVDELRGADDAAVIDAVTGWARVGAAADARKYAAIAELAAAPQHRRARPLGV